MAEMEWTTRVAARPRREAPAWAQKAIGRYFDWEDLLTLVLLLGATVSVATQAALETLPKDTEEKLLARPLIRSDNGSCYISREFGGVLDEHELSHRRIKPH